MIEEVVDSALDHRDAIANAYDIVPKDVEENLLFRRRVLRMCAGSASHRRGIMTACSRSMMFWFGSFVWTYDPRTDNGVIPFVPYPFQENAIRVIDRCIGVSDLIIRKSRDMGASWMILCAFLHRWQFRAYQSFLLVSRNEDYVDKKGNPKSLFWKLDHVLKFQPGWMTPQFSRTALRLSNEDNGSNIDGESTTGDVGRGDRRTAIMMDEFAAFEPPDGYAALAATRDTTKSRIFNSTPAGPGNAFHDLWKKDAIPKLTMLWWEHPEKNQDLQKDKSGRWTSTWYVNECARAVTRQEIAREVDAEFEGGDFQFFPSDLVDRLLRETAMPPVVKGLVRFDQDGEFVDFLESPDGRMRLWKPVPGGGWPKDRDYFIGIDVATGTGASNSVVVVGDGKTGELVAEYADPTMTPETLARLVAAVGRWFTGRGGMTAMTIWESVGPGLVFGRLLRECGYRRYYWRQSETEVGAKATKHPGWTPTPSSKLALFTEYRKALVDRAFVNRSADSIAELREMIYTTTGTIAHGTSVTTIDPSGAKSNHGDRPTACALLCRIMRGGIRAVDGPRSEPPPPGSLAHRRMLIAAERQRASKW